jgi:hypothetical protein
VGLQERLLSLSPERHRERRAGMTRPHQEHVHHYRHPAQNHLRLTPVNLGLHARVSHQRHKRLDLAQPAPHSSDIPVDLPLRDLRAMLLDQPLPDPPSGMTLLARHLQTHAQPLLDHRPIPPQPRRRPTTRRPLRRRHRRLQSLAHRPTMNPMTPRQRPDRQLLPRKIAPDRLELLHSAHSFRPFA